MESEPIPPTCVANVTVVIVTRNTSGLVRAAVKSVTESHDVFSKDIVVVDNGSTDDTADTLTREFPTVKYLRSETNLGFARANNLGAQDCHGDYLLLLNLRCAAKAQNPCGLPLNG